MQKKSESRADYSRMIHLIDCQLKNGYCAKAQAEITEIKKREKKRK